ncbi:2-hydroxyacid dehydrogenase [Tumebacillus permanentifrigoris]|uniref:Glyoxylate reductase n=1 Tax=Tumebacillus permanentifrigoris TaxID=378543 RepID=A0A316DWW8_9BACL|nr:D-glycerate dehydrogenase [Tumebacillus permanentifrigoris]PWK14334.1 glyoxylate reductase [Tumebacillus permanentifrigoris]
MSHKQPRVLVTREIPEAGLSILRQCCEVTVFSSEQQPTREQLAALLPTYDALLTMLTDPIDRELMATAPQLRVISNYAVGYNNIDIQAAEELGIAVTNTPGAMTDATADIAWALLMAVTRRIVEGDAYVRAGKWTGWAPSLLLGMEYGGKTLGIIGAGRIGLAIAKRARAFDMNVVYYNRRRLDEATEQQYGLSYVDLDTLVRSSDILSVNVPYSAESHHLLNADLLARMKPTAYLINTARGAIVEEAALVEALRTGQLAGAGLDVFEKEPEVHPGLLELPNVVLAPHLGSSTVETRDRMAVLAAENIVRVLRGEPPHSLVTSN